MATERCVVSELLNRHQATLDHAGRWADAVDDRTAELLAHEYDPLIPDNMADALADMDMIGIQALCTLLRSGNHDGLRDVMGMFQGYNSPTPIEAA